MKITITNKELKTLASFCSKCKTRKFLQHIFATVKNGSVELAATNGFALLVRKNVKTVLDGQADGYTFIIPGWLCKHFKANAVLTIERVSNAGWNAKDEVNNDVMFFAEPEGVNKPNYQITLDQLEGAKEAEEYAIFRADAIKLIENAVGLQYYTEHRPVCNYRNAPHAWIVGDIIAVAMPCRAL